MHRACGPWNRGYYANFSNYEFDLNLNIFYGIDFTANFDYCRKLIVVARKNTNRPKPILHVWINIESAFRKFFLLLFKYLAYEDRKKKNYKTRPIFVKSFLSLWRKQLHAWWSGFITQCSLRRRLIPRTVWNEPLSFRIGWQRSNGRTARGVYDI